MRLFTLTVTLLLLASCTKDKAETALVCPDTISFSTQIMPMINDNCIGCHSGQYSPDITNHAEIAANASKISKSIHGTITLMPYNGDKLADSLIQHFDCWVKQGKLDN
jgi:hypothetical protein